MDVRMLKVLRSRLDSTVMQLSEMISQEIYINVVEPTVRSWFQGGDSIKRLNESVAENVNTAWPHVNRKIELRLAEFADATDATLRQGSGPAAQGLNLQAITDDITKTISQAAGAIGSAVLGTICGGSGVALLASGPVGWILGAVIGVFVFVGNKKEIEEFISSAVADKALPSWLKKPALAKVSTELQLNRTKFEQDVYNSLQEQLKSVYAALDGVAIQVART